MQNSSNQDKQNLTVLGATGSIGDSTLDVLRLHPDKYQLYAISGYGRTDKLFELCLEFRPSRVAVAQSDVVDFGKRCQMAGLDIDVVGGQDGLCDLASDKNTHTVVAAIVGAAGLPSVLSAVRAGKRILLANKESLVMAGGLVMREAKACGASILPIDSEHNAIFQCLPSCVQVDRDAIHERQNGIKKLWLTASGGGFLHKSYDEMSRATIAEAVKHPNWSMGQKISIDSATMMNKGLELIEACHLFGLSPKQIDVAIHPQSIVHSMVEYVDGSFLAQLGTPDMKTPIAHALSYPHRIDSGVKTLNVFEMAKLEFIRPDTQKFACLQLAYQAMNTGGGATIALNAANEMAVSAFLAEQIALTDIAKVVEAVLNEEKFLAKYRQDFDDLDEILSFDSEIRAFSQAVLADFAKHKLV